MNRLQLAAELVSRIEDAPQEKKHADVALDVYLDCLDLLHSIIRKTRQIEKGRL